ncbi:hypothetical protein GCM10009817_32730 [Terrabacter lapilli]|uniref:Uncharacterized protein n=1 Tax=Terrabacter lapilli TaxID=436231 RepID=A0ABP5E1V8_9MICO
MLAVVVRGSITTALDHILLVSAVVSIVAGVLSFGLTRSEDFVLRPPRTHLAGRCCAALRSSQLMAVPEPEPAPAR